MSTRNFASIHVIGLGGTGTNVIQSLIESERFSRLLSSEDFQMACLALDVADADLASLQASYKSAVASLEGKGLSVDRLWVKAQNVKFNTPDALFEFMGRYNTYLMKDGIVVNDFRPWIASSMSIPPLAGGVGRMRALSKAVYALNYYHYMELNNVMSVFKDKVLTSKFQPVVVLVFGLGGGTGSGMVFDFARNLRSKLGSSVPIVGLCVLPSTADDLLARGPAPYTCLMEAELLFNRALNDKVAKKYGEGYRNPFNTLFFVPLDPVYNNRNNLVNAKKDLDEAIVDMLHILSSFDLADLLSRVGTNNDFGANWVHSLAYLRIRYPVEDYVNYFHEYLRLTEAMGAFLASKKDALLKINGALKSRFSALKDAYRTYVVSVNRYAKETFDAEVEDVINRAGKFDAEFKRQVKGLEDFANYYCDKWSKVVQALSFAEDTSEFAVVHEVSRWKEQISHLGKSYDEFEKELPGSLSQLEDGITAGKYLTSSQIRQIRAFVNLATLVQTSLETLRLYIRAKALVEELSVIHGKEKGREVTGVVARGDTELVPLFKAAGYIMTRPETEVKVMDQYIPGIRVVKSNSEADFKEASAGAESMQRLQAQKEAEASRLGKEIQKVRFDVSGKKKLMNKNLETLQNELIKLKAQLEDARTASEMIRVSAENLGELEKQLDMTSDYRKMLNQVVSKTNGLNAIMSGITTTGGYYERVVELSEAEQVKIMEKILREEEEALKGEGILKEIVDKDRFRSIVKSYMRIFSVANYAGLSDNYRSDLIWATVGIPTGLWDQELQGSLSSTLNVFTTVEASKSISIRQLSQVDPWTITFLILLAKARVDNVEKFSSMKNDMDAINKSEKVLFRSFLLEHGIQNVEEFGDRLEQQAGSGARKATTEDRRT